MERLTLSWTSYPCCVIALLLLSASSCRVKNESWTPKYFHDMYRHRDISGLIKGRFVRMFPLRSFAQLGQEVLRVEVEIECVFRGVAALEHEPLINVTGFGDGQDCAEAHVHVGDVYLLFLEPFSRAPNSQYRIQEFNRQLGAFYASHLKLEMVVSEYQCREPATVPSTPPTNTTLTSDQPLQSSSSPSFGYLGSRATSRYGVHKNKILFFYLRILPAIVIVLIII